MYMHVSALTCLLSNLPMEIQFHENGNLALFQAVLSDVEKIFIG